MTNTAMRRVSLAAALVAAALLTACSDEATKTGKGASEILSDQDARKAPNALVRLQEQPSFPVDEEKKPFAAMSDRDKRAPAGDKPMGLDESKRRN